MLKALLICFFLLAPTTPHAFHASITQLELKSETGRLEVAVMMFTDDLEATIQPTNHPSLYLATPKEHPRAEALVNAYVNQHISIKVDGVPVKLTFIGKETEADATWCYLESGVIGKFKKLEISNTVLLAQFEEQTNIIHLKKDGKTQAKMTNNGTKKAVFD